MPKFKQFIAKIETDDTERSITAIISSASVDRDKEVLDPKGIKVDKFMLNPVVQWAHQYDKLPIGRAMWVKTGTVNGVKVIKAKWSPTPRPKGHEGNWFPDTVYDLYKGGFLNAFSVGFQPNSSKQPTPEDIKKNPELADAHRVFDDWDLLEFSAVPVPANPDALAIAVKSKAIELPDSMIEELGIEIKEAEPEIKEVEPEIEVNPLIKAEPIKIKVYEIEHRVSLAIDVEAITQDEIRKAKGIVYA